MRLKDETQVPPEESLKGFHMDIEVHNNFEAISNYEQEALSRNIATRFDEFVFTGPTAKKEV